MKLGIYFYALGTIAAGVFDLIWREFEPAHQPIQAWGNVPGERISAYVAGVWLIVAGAAFLLRSTARTAAAACAVIYSVFAVFWFPRFVTAPHLLGQHISIYLGILGGVAQQAILVAPALIVYTSSANRTSPLPDTATIIARWTFGLSSLNFAIDHFNAVHMVAALVPAWMPLGGNFWAVLTGIAFLFAGIAILAGVLDVLAARLLGLMLLVFSVMALAPRVFVSPHNHIAWGSNAYNLAAVGAAWIFSEWLANHANRTRTLQQPSAA
ncbi:MAG TPA: hypothetical protein VJO35_06955 [Terriglobales bacterium]|nr:hypothetical protein [Terriglobales bacterium]